MVLPFSHSQSGSVLVTERSLVTHMLTKISDAALHCACLAMWFSLSVIADRTASTSARFWHFIGIVSDS